MTPSICHHVVSRQLDTESYPEKVLTCQQAYGPILRRSLVVPGVATHLDCLTQAFEAHELHRVPQPDGTIIHAVVRMGDAREAGRTEV